MPPEDGDSSISFSIRGHMPGYSRTSLTVTWSSFESCSYMPDVGWRPRMCARIFWAILKPMPGIALMSWASRKRVMVPCWTWACSLSALSLSLSFSMSMSMSLWLSSSSSAQAPHSSVESYGGRRVVWFRGLWTFPASFARSLEVEMPTVAV
ncbi:hypothetical protein I7I53_09744 [Histoplasma capsulatum var. duboisii H88]|uniref:Uncharacterized protein n=1 Tax=Ajellomyces capsulatus (strain H88) TaxID=544711 RepID=A0A8A1L627_AJEC8|nr:hypothetical protein I7I53_09744 [Histoplasma capsulatum var. duboisii H88]